MGNTVTDNTGTGLRLGPGAGYKDDAISGNGAMVAGGAALGSNLCDGNTTCP